MNENQTMFETSRTCYSNAKPIIEPTATCWERSFSSSGKTSRIVWSCAAKSSLPYFSFPRSALPCRSQLKSVSPSANLAPVFCSHHKIFFRIGWFSIWRTEFVSSRRRQIWPMCATHVAFFTNRSGYSGTTNSTLFYRKSFHVRRISYIAHASIFRVVSCTYCTRVEPHFPLSCATKP